MANMLQATKSNAVDVNDDGVGKSFQWKTTAQQLNNRLQPTSDGEILFKLIETLIRSQANQMSCDVMLVEIVQQRFIECDSTWLQA